MIRICLFQIFFSLLLISHLPIGGHVCKKNYQEVNSFCFWKVHNSDLCKENTKSSKIKICSFHQLFSWFPHNNIFFLVLPLKDFYIYTVFVIFQQRNATHFQYLLRSFVNFWWKNLNILKTVIVQKADQIQWTIMGYCLFLYDCSCIIIWVCCSCCSCPSVDTFVSVQQWFFAQKKVGGL